jgi:tetratricopeptide (TPR) repeat protein
MVLRVVPLALTLALFAPGTASAQDAGDAAADAANVRSVERDESRDPAEVEAYREVLERFSARTAELEADVRDEVAQRKTEELDKIAQGYDYRILALEERERAQRETAIQRLREFLVRYPAAPDSDNVRFRLAELYYEKAVVSWLEAQQRFGDVAAEYEKKFAEAQRLLDEEGDPTLFEQLEELESPLKDLGPSIELYQQIVSRNEALPPEERWDRLDRAYYSLGFAFLDDQAKQFDIVRARQSFEQLLAVAGEESELADAAHMFLGKILFEELKRYEDALDQYRRIVAKGPDGRYYEEASFQLAWIYYKLGARNADYEQAAFDLFTRILDESEQALRETGRESDYAGDARLNLSRMLAEAAFRNYDPTSLPVVEGFFQRVGPRPWERNIYKTLAEVHAGCIPAPDPCPPGTVTLGRYEVEHAIAIYERLQTDPRWVKEPDNPIYQMKLIWLLPRRDDPDVQREVPEQQRLLVERYGETIRDPYTGEQKPNPWWTANRNNADALDTVRQFVEGSLAQVATGLFVEADAKNDPALYREAADKFREYMDKFPIADNFYQSQWYLANALMSAASRDPQRPWQPYEEALREFTSLAQSRDNHPYGDGAIYRIADARREILNAKVDEYGPITERPARAEVEKVVNTDFGGEIQVFRLSDDHRAYIDALDLVLDFPFEEPFDPSVPDYREAVAVNRAYMLYTPAVILAAHNRFDEARARAERVIAEIPDTKEASFAANLIVAAYNAEGNLEEVRNQTRRFSRMTFDDPDIKAKFGALEKDVSFIICQQLSQKGDRLGAATCYESYLTQYPDTKEEKYKFALYNAAQNYEFYGRAERANELFEKYVRLYPSDSEARKIMMRIAGNYEATFEIDKAISYYKLLIDNDPRREFEGAADALYNIAYLKVGIGDHRGAAQGFEQYARLFPDKDDAVDVLFRAGAEWENVSPAEGRAFYQRFLRAYGPSAPKSKPDYVLEAMYKIAQGQPEGSRAYERAMDDIVATFDRYAAQQVQVGFEGRNIVARWAVYRLQQKYDELTNAKLNRNEDHDTDLIERKALTEVPAFNQEATRVFTTYPDFEHGTGALYLLARSLLWIAELGYALECPTRYRGEECDIWLEIYDTSMRPVYEEFEQRARAGFERLIALAKEQKRHSPWIGKAYSDLNRLDPFQFPDVKAEVRGDVDVRALPTLKPRDIPAPEAAPAGEGAPPAGETAPPGEGGSAPAGGSAPPNPWGGP